MKTKENKMELYKQYRPKRFKDIAGQDEAVSVLSSWLKDKQVPHALLLAGPSGVGKTTIARILQTKLKCHPNDFNEINSADFRGIETVRQVRRYMNFKAKYESRIWLVDEAHRLTGQAQDAFLKILEDTPDEVYFILATTEPEKLNRTIKTRCSLLSLRLLKDEEMLKLLVQVRDKAKLESVSSQDVLEKITDLAEGSARMALNILDKIKNIESEEEQMEIVLKSSIQNQTDALVRLLFHPTPSWKRISEAIKNMEEDLERVRHGVMNYAAAILLNGGGKIADRAFITIEAFRDPWYDCGKPGLVAACWQVIQTK